MQYATSDSLRQLAQDAAKAFAACQSLAQLTDAHRAHLGKNSGIADALKSVGGLAPEQRADFAREAQQVRGDIQAAFDARTGELESLELTAGLERETIDVTLPGRAVAHGRQLGSLHPITLTLARFLEYFKNRNYTVVEGPEVEFEALNFDALNIAPHHPARDDHDTMYTGLAGMVLRTQTSNMQIRYLLAHGAPCRIVAPGRVYRRDSDQTHTPMFHQVEGMVVGKDITLDDLVRTISEALSAFFRRDAPVRFRKNHFPFTEPSAEVDVGCGNCSGNGCSICAGGGWVEILGCGMIHPQVLENCGINSDEYTGFAFGIGIERLCMLLWELSDIRELFHNDLTWLRRLPGSLRT